MMHKQEYKEHLGNSFLMQRFEVFVRARSDGKRSSVLSASKITMTFPHRKIS